MVAIWVDIFKCICKENDTIPIQKSQGFIPRSPIVSGNGLTPNRRQAKAWTNAEPVHLRVYVALGGKISRCN